MLNFYQFAMGMLPVYGNGTEKCPRCSGVIGTGQLIDKIGDENYHVYCGGRVRSYRDGQDFLPTVKETK